MKGKKRVRVRKLQGTPYVISEDEKIAETSKGQVYVAYNIEAPNEQLVAKIINVVKAHEIQSLKKEMEKLTGHVHHQNLVRYHSIQVLNESSCCLIMEYCNEGSLSHLFAEMKLMPEQKIWSFLQQFCKGYQVLLDSNLIHARIKPSNILVSDGNYKITDVGISPKAQTVQYHMGHSDFLYMPPEIQRYEISSKSDVFSVGCIVYQFAYDTVHPFQACGNKAASLQEHCAKVRSSQVVLKQRNKKGQVRSPQLRQLIQRMLSLEVQKRISWQQIFEHQNIGINKYHKEKAGHPHSQRQSQIDLLRTTLVQMNRSSICIKQDAELEHEHHPPQEFIAFEQKLEKDKLRYLQQVLLRLKIILLSIIHCNNKISTVVRQNARHKKLQSHIIQSVKKVAVQGLLYLLKNMEIISYKIGDYDGQVTKDIKAILNTDKQRVIEQHKKLGKAFKNMGERALTDCLKGYDLRSFEHCLHNLLTGYCDYYKEGKEVLRVVVAILTDIYDAALRLTEMTQKQKICWRTPDFEEVETVMDYICLQPHRAQQFHSYLASKEVVTERELADSLKRVGLLFQ